MSGWYKRRTQLILFVLGVGVAHRPRRRSALDGRRRAVAQTERRARRASVAQVENQDDEVAGTEALDLARRICSSRSGGTSEHRPQDCATQSGSSPSPGWLLTGVRRDVRCAVLVRCARPLQQLAAPRGQEGRRRRCRRRMRRPGGRAPSGLQVDDDRDACPAVSGAVRRRIAAAWAGKPSWSARAMIDGAMRASAAASARATAVRLRNASTVMPDDTSAKPDVGSDAGQPITKLAALNGVCWPTRISPALTQRRRPRASTSSSATATWRCSGA